MKRYVLCLTLVLVGCASTESAGDPASSASAGDPAAVDLPHREPETDVLGDAELVGVLQADADRDGGCVWVVGADDTIHSIEWVEPYSVRFPADGGPAALLDERGEIVAREGETIELGGGFRRVGDPPLERCQMTDEPAFYAYLLR